VTVNGGSYGLKIDAAGFAVGLDRVAVSNTSVAGLYALDCAISVRDSVFRNSAGPGIYILNAASITTSAMIERSEMSFNHIGLLVAANGGSVTTRLSDSVIAGNNTGLQQQNGGTIVTFRTNMIAGNTTDGVPALSISLK
jgi:hypothetical protein